MIYDSIKNYLEDNMSDKSFFDILHSNQELQKCLEYEDDIPPYTNDGSLLHYLFFGNVKDLRFIINVRDALRQFLLKNDIKFEYSERSDDIYDIILKTQPKWLNVDPSFFSEICSDYNKKNKREIKSRIEDKIKKEFIYLKKYPQWLQAPNWPIENGKPLVFIGELDLSNISHDTTRVYVFYNSQNNSFINIKQSL